MDFSSLADTPNGYYLTNAIMTLLTPKSNDILLKMQKGMPLPGMNPLNVEDIVSAEAAKVYDALITNIKSFILTSNKRFAALLVCLFVYLLLKN